MDVVIVLGLDEGVLEGLKVSHMRCTLASWYSKGWFWGSLRMSSTSGQMMLPSGDVGLGGIVMRCVGFLGVVF